MVMMMKLVMMVLLVVVIIMLLVVVLVMMMIMVAVVVEMTMIMMMMVVMLVVVEKAVFTYLGQSFSNRVKQLPDTFCSLQQFQNYKKSIYYYYYYSLDFKIPVELKIYLGRRTLKAAFCTEGEQIKGKFQIYPQREWRPGFILHPIGCSQNMIRYASHISSEGCLIPTRILISDFRTTVHVLFTQYMNRNLKRKHKVDCMRKPF